MSLGKLPAARTLTRAWFGTVVTNGVLLIVGMTTGILAARLLGPEERGVLGAIMFWPSLFAAAARTGIDEALVRHWAAHAASAASLVASAMGIVVFAGLSVWLLTIPLVPVLVGVRQQASAEFVAIFAGMWIVAVNTNAVLGAADRAAGRFVRANVLRAGPNLLYLSGIALLVLSNGVTVANFAAAALVGLVLTVVVRLVIGYGAHPARPSRELLETLTRTGIRFHAGALAALVSSHADRAILFLIFSDHEAGLYVAAWTFAASGLTALASAVAFVLAPNLAAERDPARARAMLAVGLRRVALLLYTGVGGALLVTPWLMPLLFGSAFAEAVPMAMFMLIAVVPLMLRQTAVSCLRALGEARIGVTSELAAMGGFLLAASLLIGVGGRAEALAAATIVGNVAGLAMVGCHLVRHHGLSVRVWALPGSEMVADARTIALRLRGAIL